MLCAAVFLDQRFKDLDSFVPGSDRKDTREAAVKLQMLELTVADEQTQPQSEAETNGHSSTTKKTKPGKVSPTSFQYLTETKVKRKRVSRLGEWWKSRQVQYPLMFQVLTLELQMSHICDMRRCALSAVVAFL